MEFRYVLKSLTELQYQSEKNIIYRLLNKYKETQKQKTLMLFSVLVPLREFLFFYKEPLLLQR